MYAASDQQTQHYAFIEAFVQIYHSKQSAFILEEYKKSCYICTDTTRSRGIATVAVAYHQLLAQSLLCG